MAYLSKSSTDEMGEGLAQYETQKKCDPEKNADRFHRRFANTRLLLLSCL